MPTVADDFEETGDGGGFFAPRAADAPWEAAAGGFRWRSGAVCERGQRRYNEDTCVERHRLVQTTSFFGVYDGHSGGEVSQLCARDLHARFARHLFDDDHGRALERAFLALDADYCAAAARGDASPDAGATALAAVLTPDAAAPAVVVANCGDCAAVLCRGGAAVPLSSPHAPAPGTAEAERVLAAGGWITTETDLCVGRLHAMDLDDPEISADAHKRVALNEIHRVCGEVAVTRAIGDVDFKGWKNGGGVTKLEPCFAYPEGHPRTFNADLLVATPEIERARLAPGDEFLLMATDGLWDVVAPDEAVHVAHKLFAAGHAPRAVAHRLVDRALRLGSGDNVTVLLVQFDVPDPAP